jgi:D-beta-D-heptose 7-phosphate kinase/D-beta-D-heptose 1-phosphate adenosyltransferase
MKKVFVNGTFDILHRGHLEMLLFARNQGDYLTVAIDSDRRVKELKGSNRPINNMMERATLLTYIRPVDQVVVFDTDEELIKLISEHDIMVKGSDYRGKPIIGENVCKELIFFELINGYSTTNKIQDIINR